MRWCRFYEGQRDEAWGCEGPSHTGLNIIHSTSQVHRFHRRSRKSLWGRAVSRKSRHKTWGGWSPQKTKGPEDVRGRTVNTGRVGMCMLLWWSQIHYSHMVTQNQVRGLWGLTYTKNQRSWVHVRVNNLGMGRVGVCILLWCSQIHYNHMVT